MTQPRVMVETHYADHRLAAHSTRYQGDAFRAKTATQFDGNTTLTDQIFSRPAGAGIVGNGNSNDLDFRRCHRRVVLLGIALWGDKNECGAQTQYLELL